MEGGSTETRNDIEEILELTRENNRIIRKMQRHSRYRRILSFLYFLIILGVMVYLYYYLQPYIENMVHAYQFLFSEDGIEQMIRQSIEAHTMAKP